MEIEMSEDGYWRWRIIEDEMWLGGYKTYREANEAALFEWSKRFACL